jgi:hypothetical protein
MVASWSIWASELLVRRVEVPLLVFERLDEALKRAIPVSTQLRFEGVVPGQDNVDDTVLDLERLRAVTDNPRGLIVKLLEDRLPKRIHQLADQSIIEAWIATEEHRASFGPGLVDLPLQAIGRGPQNVREIIELLRDRVFLG